MPFFTACLALSTPPLAPLRSQRAVPLLTVHARITVVTVFTATAVTYRLRARASFALLLIIVGMERSAR